MLNKNDAREKIMEKEGINRVKEILVKNDVRIICRRIYDKCQKNGLYHLVKEKQPNLLKTLYDILENQQKDLEKYRLTNKERKSVKHMDANAAIKYYLNTTF